MARLCSKATPGSPGDTAGQWGVEEVEAPVEEAAILVSQRGAVTVIRTGDTGLPRQGRWQGGQDGKHGAQPQGGDQQSR